MGKKTVIVLGAPLGRVGSSALMGLLHAAGANIGGDHSGLGKASKSNPKGHFEPPSIKKFLENSFKGYFPNLMKTPPMKLLDTVGKAHYKGFGRLLQLEFGVSSPLALKGGRLLVLPFLDELRSIYDVKVLMLNRPFEDQTKSIFRVWKRSKRLRPVCNIKYISERLRAWKVFIKKTRKKYARFPYLDVDFNNLMHKTIPTMKMVNDFVGLPHLSPLVISNWIDPSLIHSKKK